MKKFLLSTLLFIGGILGSIQAEGPVFQWAKSLMEIPVTEVTMLTV